MSRGGAKRLKEVVNWGVGRRFGASNETFEARVRAADSATLDRWAERVLFADSIEAVLDVGG